MEDFERTKELTEERIRRRKKKRCKEMLMHILVCSAVVIIFLCVLAVVLNLVAPKPTASESKRLTKYIENPPVYQEELLSINEYSNIKEE